MTIELAPTINRKIFIDNLQAAFRKANGKNKFHSEDLPRFFDKTNATLLNILADKEIVGGAVLIINDETQHNKLLLLFINASKRNSGIGFAAWQEIEKLYPNTKVWYASTSWNDKRNLHFYLNKCGFVAFYIYEKREVYLGLEKVMG